MWGDGKSVLLLIGMHSDQHNDDGAEGDDPPDADLAFGEGEPEVGAAPGVVELGGAGLCGLDFADGLVGEADELFIGAGEGDPGV